jgi:hypothetical protein
MSSGSLVDGNGRYRFSPPQPYFVQTFMVFIPVSASVRVLNTLLSPTTTVVVVGF